MKKEKINIKDLHEGDKILGPNNEIMIVKTIVPPYYPKRMFRIIFSDGMKVDCTYNHLWPVVDNKYNFKEVISTQDMYDKGKFPIFGIGTNSSDAKIVKKIIEIRPKKVCCINVERQSKNKNDETDHLFLVCDSFNRVVVTHNCQQRVVCGRVGSTASMMALGSALGTSIDGNRKGAGIAQSNGANIFLQLYFEDFKWITEWYKKCGWDKKGWRKSENNPKMLDINPYDINGSSDISTDELDDIFDTEAPENENIDSNFAFDHEIVNIEFEGLVGTIDRTEKQKYEK